MNIRIRPYHNDDYQEISSWMITKFDESILSDSTFILDIDDVPAFCLTMYFTNSKELAFIENFAGNPNLKEIRKPYSQTLWVYLEDLAKQLGYKKVICLSNVDDLTNKYESFGYTKIMNNVDVLRKVL